MQYLICRKVLPSPIVKAGTSTVLMSDRAEVLLFSLLPFPFFCFAFSVPEEL
jgi:hypothetical protein